MIVPHLYQERFAQWRVQYFIQWNTITQIVKSGKMHGATYPMCRSSIAFSKSFYTVQSDPWFFIFLPIYMFLLENVRDKNAQSLLTALISSSLSRDGN